MQSLEPMLVSFPALGSAEHADIYNRMLAIAYAAITIGFYVFITRTAKDVPSPLGVWVNTEEETPVVKAA